jgi:putative DNA-invertase from lambdoid prophage Rac
MNMATFAYGRCSTEQQTTENQRLEIEAAGYAVDYWYTDTISGKTSASERPQFAALLSQIRNGETLFVSKLDRIGRDAQDVGATIKLLTKRKIHVIVLQLGKLDLTSATGKMMLTMLSAVAEMERDLLVERTQAGLARAVAEGKKLWPHPEDDAGAAAGHQGSLRQERICKLLGSSVHHQPGDSPEYRSVTRRGHQTARPYTRAFCRLTMHPAQRTP